MRKAASAALKAIGGAAASTELLPAANGWCRPASQHAHNSRIFATLTTNKTPTLQHWGPGVGPAAVQQRRGQADDAAAATAQLAPCERAPPPQAPNQLDRQLEQAGREEGAEAILSLVDSQGEHFSELNVVTALRELAQANSSLTPEELVRSPAFQTIVDMILAGMSRFEPGLLAEAVRSCGEIGASEEMLLDEIARHIMGHPSKLSASDVAGLCYGFAALDHSPGVTLFDTLAERAEAVKADFSQEQRQQVMVAYEKLGYGSKAPILG